MLSAHAIAQKTGTAETIISVLPAGFLNHKTHVVGSQPEFSQEKPASPFISGTGPAVKRF
jgi:hypothetical protein